MKKPFTITDFFQDLPAGETFIYTEGNSFTYSSCLQRVREIKSALGDIPCPGGFAAILSDNIPENICLVLALWEKGITPVLINTKLSLPEINELLDESPCDLIFTEYNENSYKRPSVPIADLSKEADELNRIIYPDETAIVIYTSGSTGKAKGVELTFRTFSESAELQNKFLQQKPGDRWLLSIPFYHIGGFSIFIRTLLNRMSVAVPNSLKMTDICNAITKFNPNYISLIGTQLKKILDDEFNPGNQVKNILIGGGFTDDSIINLALKRGLKISKVYGSTETASFIAAADRVVLVNSPSAAGKELNKGSVVILDENKNILSEDRVGEIALRGIPLMKGYMNNEQGTSEKFYNGMFLTGDIGFRDKDGLVFIKMRRTDLIVSGGENIDPREVENKILSIEGIEDVYVFSEPDLKWGQIAAALISTEKEFRSEELKTMLKGKLAGYKIPKKFYITSRIPRNELGKVLATELKKMLSRELL